MKRALSFFVMLASITALVWVAVWCGDRAGPRGGAHPHEALVLEIGLRAWEHDPAVYLPVHLGLWHATVQTLPAPSAAEEGLAIGGEAHPWWQNLRLRGGRPGREAGIPFEMLSALPEARIDFSRSETGEAWLAVPVDALPRSGRFSLVAELSWNEQRFVSPPAEVRIMPDALSETERELLVARRHLWKGEWTYALEAAERATAAEPGHIPALVTRGDALAGLQRFEEALEAYEEALEWVDFDLPHPPAPIYHRIRDMVKEILERP